LRASRHREVDSKSNEITAVPELLDTRHPDAMSCQKDGTLPEPEFAVHRHTAGIDAIFQKVRLVAKVHAF
jgi:predicted transposase YbfD/YdcC